MTRLVSWRILCTIDIRRNHAVQVAPPDHESKRNSSLVHTFGIVCCPRNAVRRSVRERLEEGQHLRVRNAGIDANRAKIDTRVLNVWATTSQKHRKSDDAKD